MTRYLIGAAVVVLLSASPLFAADTMKSANPPAAGSDTSRREGTKLRASGLAS